MSNETVVIVAAKRTPMGGFNGALSSMSATELGANAIKASCENVDLSQIDEVIMGCVLPAGLGQAPARQASLHAGLPLSAGVTTINKVCGSGLKAVMMAHDLIKAGSASAVIAGGMESMSNAPYMLPKARSGYRMGHGQVLDHMMLDGLENAYDGKAMGCFAQDTADEENITRGQMDEFALSSLSKANAAIENGSFENEIAPHTIKTRKGDVTVSVDEQPGNARPEKIPSLRAAFKKDGTITAANASSISDGASALVLTSEEGLAGRAPLARIVAHTTHSIHPSEFTLAPIGAIEKLLAKTGWDKGSVDLFEINEAFAAQSIAVIKELKIPNKKVNINGGAIALGHPIGASGTRVLVTLIHEMIHQNKSKGCATLCIGGGMGIAMCIEKN